MSFGVGKCDRDTMYTGNWDWNHLQFRIPPDGFCVKLNRELRVSFHGQYLQSVSFQSRQLAARYATIYTTSEIERL